MNNIFEKQELQNKLQGFQQGKDYSISSVENGKQIYNIHSDELKKKFGSNLVYCRIEKSDEKDFHYRGRFEGYANGGRYSHQVWWSGENFNPEVHSGFEKFDEHWKGFFDWGTKNNLMSFSHEIGNICENWSIKNNFFNQDLIKDFRITTTKFGPPNLNQTNEKKRFVVGHEEQGQVEKYCANHECWNVDKSFVTNDNYCQYCGQLLSLASTDHPIKITNQPKPELEKIQQFELEKQAKDQQITNPQEENKVLSQRLEAERQAKEEVEQQAQTERDNLHIELKQLREELSKTQEKLVQLQAELKVQLGKSPDPGIKKAAEQLAETHQKLKEVDKLTQKSNPSNEELNKIKEQLNNSRQTLAAAAAHRQLLIQESDFQPQTEVKFVAPSQPKSHASYLIGGLVILGVSALVLGYFLGQRKKEGKN